MKNYLISLLIISISTLAQAQMTGSFTKSVNTKCDGVECYYSGPTIMINEIMVAPNEGDGTISGTAAGLGDTRGEWIELYNPNKCESVDISCYYLGSSADQNGFMEGQAFQLPN